MTIRPRIGTVSITSRIASTATWSECLRSPCPIVFADSIAAASGLEEAINATAAVAPAPIRPAVRRLVSRLERQSLTSALAAFGNDLVTLPNFPAEIRAPQGTLPGVS